MRMLPQLIVMGSGAVLILAGIAAVFLQVWAEWPLVTLEACATMEACLTRVKVMTRYPGIGLIAIGAMLEIAGYYFSRPRKAPKRSS